MPAKPSSPQWYARDRGLVMGEVIPGVAVLAVILPDGSPLAFAQVGPPFLPGGLLLASLFKSVLFGCFHCRVLSY